MEESAKHSRKGLEDLIARESKRLLAFIRQGVAEEDAEDLFQDVLYQLTSTGTDSIEHLSAWLYTVARNRITDLYRKRKPLSFSQIEKDRQDESDVLYLADILPDIKSGPEEELLRKTIMETLEESIEDLPTDQRQVFILHEFEGKSFKEISEDTGVEVPTLLSRKRYAVQKLRNRLRNLYMELITN